MASSTVRYSPVAAVNKVLVHPLFGSTRGAQPRETLGKWACKREVNYSFYNTARQGKARQGKARHGKARQGKAEQDEL